MSNPRFPPAHARLIREVSRELGQDATITRERCGCPAATWIEPRHRYFYVPPSECSEIPFMRMEEKTDTGWVVTQTCSFLATPDYEEMLEIIRFGEEDDAA